MSCLEIPMTFKEVSDTIAPQETLSERGENHTAVKWQNMGGGIGVKITGITYRSRHEELPSGEWMAERQMHH